jgi:hypothetical protein
MKKLIAAAVATSVSAIALADVSITGSLKTNYTHKDYESTSVNDSDTFSHEGNLSIKGKSGDTSVVANFEVDQAATDGTAIDVEDLFITTKVAGINVKAGDFASGTTALGGEIDDGRRATNKIDLSTNIGSAKVGYATSQSGNAFNNDAAAVYASIPVAGMTLGIKDESDSYTIVGLKGEMNGINFRIENKDKDAANSDTLFYQVGTKLGDVSISVEGIDADTSELVEEDDSSIFAQEMGDTAAGNDTGKDGVDGVSQVTLATSVDGTAVKFRAGTLQGIAGKQDADFFRVEASRPLASGATLTVSYDDYEDAGVAVGSAKYDTQLLEVDLAVKF